VPDYDRYKQLITARLAELGERMQGIETELDKPKPKDSEERAIDLEDDEVLEGLGMAAQKEAGLLREALVRIEHGSFGVCEACANEISDARLAAVPYAVLCRDCAANAEKSRRA
jgi:RNA polymerase-binding transcription factor DksA